MKSPVLEEAPHPAVELQGSELLYFETAEDELCRSM